VLWLDSPDFLVAAAVLAAADGIDGAVETVPVDDDLVAVSRLQTDHQRVAAASAGNLPGALPPRLAMASSQCEEVLEAGLSARVAAVVFRRA
jgi:hypothetical protein